VLLGHTLDDQAETVLLGLARGSGIRSLAGMAVRSGRLLRPLLGLRRAVTEQACVELGLQPWSDPHNADPSYARVRVRRDALPALETALGPGIAEGLARTAALARNDADLLDTLAAEADPGTDTLDCAELMTRPAALRTRVIRRWLLRHGALEATATHVAAVDTLVTRWHGQGKIHLPGVSVTRQDGSLHCQPDD
jgi:tRNA(Ile)-lysidine synthase